jgi:phosphatidylinositol glycan class B
MLASRLGSIGTSTPGEVLIWPQEWQYQLRSSLHPALFGGLYWAADNLMTFLQFFPPAKAFFLVALPQLAQSVFAALGEFYMWRLATKIYGNESNVPWAAV